MDPRRGDRTFPILGDPPFSKEKAEIAKGELLVAGFPSKTVILKKTRVERLVVGSPEARLAASGIHLPNSPYETVVAFNVKAIHLNWTFFRFWYYWRAYTDDRPIPEDTAKIFNQDWHDCVRVRGFAGGAEVTGPVSNYDIDTPDGLAQFVHLLYSIDRGQRQK